MPTQLAIEFERFEVPAIVPVKRKLTSSERWQVFKTNHRWFLEAAVRMTREHVAKGNKRWSMKAVFELLRPEFGTRGCGRLDNTFTPFAAREVMHMAPDLEGVFELR